jgi:hypothetical protein
VAKELGGLRGSRFVLHDLANESGAQAVVDLQLVAQATCERRLAGSAGASDEH